MDQTHEIKALKIAATAIFTSFKRIVHRLVETFLHNVPVTILHGAVGPAGKPRKGLRVSTSRECACPCPRETILSINCSLELVYGFLQRFSEGCWAKIATCQLGTVGPRAGRRGGCEGRSVRTIQEWKGRGAGRAGRAGVSAWRLFTASLIVLEQVVVSAVLCHGSCRCRRYGLNQQLRPKKTVPALTPGARRAGLSSPGRRVPSPGPGAFNLRATDSGPGIPAAPWSPVARPWDS
eukprot:754687-Hanusia_phi.AAC.2